MEKAELVHDTGRRYHSERVAFPEPSVVRLAHYVRLPRTAADRHHPAQCLRPGRPPLPVLRWPGREHRPCHAASRGGAHIWENVVAACRRCNAVKEDRLLEETGFTLHRMPHAPRSRVWLLAASGDVHAEWEPYVAPLLDRAG